MREIVYVGLLLMYPQILYEWLATGWTTEKSEFELR
jgi:hypothetical protein